MDTKIVNELHIDHVEFVELVDQILEANVEAAASKLLGEDSELIEELTKLINSRWVMMENKDVYYDHETVSLFPKIEDFECEFVSGNSLNSIDQSQLQFSGFNGEIMTLDEVKKAFIKSMIHPYLNGSSEVKSKLGVSYELSYKTTNGLLGSYNIQTGLSDSTRYIFGMIIPIFRLNAPDSPKVNRYQALFYWLQHGLIPEGLSQESYDLYLELLDLYQFDFLTYENSVLMLNEDEIYEEILDGDFFKSEIAGIWFNREKLIEDVKNGKQRLKIGPKHVQDRLLNCEFNRAGISKYDKKLIKDPNRGHWDLWESSKEEDMIPVYLKEELIARNPKSDIKEGGVIGIDFGTKSTVVVYQENSDYTLPMRVGMSDFSKKTEAHHYENPTVMEFIDINHFLEKYRTKAGRPETAWEDVTVSHQAFESLMNSSSDHFYSIISELKQWAGVENRQIRIKDKKGHAVVLPPFLELSDQDLNPIELYAYYIGLYINNQHNGLYLEYFLSFPVTYGKDIREKILLSFEKGLKKSLPPTLLEDGEVMSKFRVSSGASEPAAYAICALQEYGFDPEDEEKIFYGVFDFGGGTTDFDFGIWREANHKERRFDYTIEHFEAGGDRYLGGENLLELLAFEVFKQNQDKLRESKITFTLPPECQRFPGSEILLSQSQEAKLNTKQLMERLRPLWERHEEYEKEFETGLMRVDLFDTSGSALLKFELEVSMEELEEILAKRIEKGIRNFFDSLRRSFENPIARDAKKVHIFLAGNSSKSQIVKDLFQSFIEEESKQLQNQFSEQQDYFEIFPPLGTEEAYVKMEERGMQPEIENMMRPNGKTGVAFGIVQSRKGGTINVIDHNSVEDEAKFNFFLGMSKKGKFKVIVDRGEEYMKWHEFIDASVEDFELYYTSLPEATRNQLPIHQASRKKIRIDQTNDDAYVYIRTVSPTIIEFVVATEAGILSGDYMTDIKQLELN